MIKGDEEKNDLSASLEEAQRRGGACREAQTHYYDVPKGVGFENDRSSSSFWLGPVVGYHEIGEYGFLEYLETDFNHLGPRYGQLTGCNKFSIYINGHSTSRSASSLDEALIVAIAFKRDGCNSQAARFFLRATEPDAD